MERPGPLISLLVTVAMGQVACSEPQGSVVDADLGRIEDVLDELTKSVWPGVVDGDGNRFIRLLNGFFDDKPTSYWFTGFAPRFTADAFWFCRDGDDSCPLTGDGKLNGAALVGDPVFTRIPGENEYSPYWRINVVRVPEEYEPNALKSTLSIERAEADGVVRIEPLRHDLSGAGKPEPVITHCLLVLDGTTLEGNGRDLVGTPGRPSLRMYQSQGWHKQYRVQLFDFSVSEGLFAPDPDSGDRPLMPAADIFVFARDCAGGSSSPVCGYTSALLPAVSERGVEADLTGDGDRADTNNVVAAFPGAEPADPNDRPYSALWAVSVVTIPAAADADVSLIDTTGDQLQSDVTSVLQMRDLVGAGRLAEPEPMSESQAGNRIPGNDGEVFFNCPAQVPAP